MTKFDAIVVGAGPGGYECAIRLSQNGKQTALIEENKLGGVCLNRGCIPTKTLLHSAELYTQARSSSSFGINIGGEITFDYKKIIERKNAISDQLSKGVAFLEKKNKVTVFNARASFTGPRSIVLSTGEDLSADIVVIATGSLPAPIPIPGTNLPNVVDSTGLLDMTECPKSIVIVGGGVIGTEFATFFNQLGVKVTIVEMIDRILGPLDKDISSIVDTKLRKQGVNIILGVRVESIEKGLKVNYVSKDGAKGSAEGDVVLLAGGRRPNTANMGLENTGIVFSKRGFIETDSLCRTNVPGIYAIGDVNGKILLAHVASSQGLVSADHASGKTVKAVNLHQIPSCVYCSPECASIGLTQEQAENIGKNIGIGLFNLAGNGKALTTGENEGIAKFVFDKDTEEILGFHVVGPRATDLVAEVSAVMKCEGTIKEISDAVHPHPTVSEVVMEAAHACHGLSVNQ